MVAAPDLVEAALVSRSVVVWTEPVDSAIGSILVGPIHEIETTATALLQMTPLVSSANAIFEEVVVEMEEDETAKEADLVVVGREIATVASDLTAARVVTSLRAESRWQLFEIVLHLQRLRLSGRV